jgi:DNA-binding TFAR19-related protein (PDSD5 family)
MDGFLAWWEILTDTPAADEGAPKSSAREDEAVLQNILDDEALHRCDLTGETAATEAARRAILRVISGSYARGRVDADAAEAAAEAAAAAAAVAFAERAAGELEARKIMLRTAERLRRMIAPRTWDAAGLAWF